MAYEYDAFFSYKRDRESDSWHLKVKSKLEFWLRHELQRDDIRIFIDTEEIRTGVHWNGKVADALKRSRCIICMWSPLYFQSKWCLSEWKTFVERERLYKRNLIMPASYFGGKTFPPHATARQFVDFSKFASTIPAFWKTGRAVDFENLLLRPFANDLALLIRDAPPFDDAFPVVEVPDRQVAPEQPIRRPADV